MLRERRVRQGAIPKCADFCLDWASPSLCLTGKSGPDLGKLVQQSQFSSFPGHVQSSRPSRTERSL